MAIFQDNPSKMVPYHDVSILDLFMLTVMGWREASCAEDLLTPIERRHSWPPAQLACYDVPFSTLAVILDVKKHSVCLSTGWAKKNGLFLNVNNFFCV